MTAHIRTKKVITSLATNLDSIENITLLSPEQKIAYFDVTISLMKSLDLEDSDEFNNFIVRREFLISELEKR